MFIKRFSDLTLSKAGVRARFMEGACLGAHLRLDNDVSRLFPYINAAVQGARLYDQPDYIHLDMDDVQCTLYPRDVMAVPFENQVLADRFAHHLIDFLNNLYAQKDTVIPDYKRHKSISVVDILRLLPQTNCRKCAFLTCMAFAAALSQRRTTPDKLS
jgi:ArsR family metal-binding transcriptional regulator